MNYGIPKIARRFRIGSIFNKQVFAAGVAVAVLASSVFIAPQKAQAATYTLTLDYSSVTEAGGDIPNPTGGAGNWSWTVPDGVSSMTVEVKGGGGGNGYDDAYGTGGTGGAGGKVIANFSSPSGAYTIKVGTGGGPNQGGGASYVRQVGVWAVAAGGGGGGSAAGYDDCGGECFEEYNGGPGTPGETYLGVAGGTEGAGGQLYVNPNGQPGGSGAAAGSGVSVTLNESGGGSTAGIDGRVIITYTTSGGDVTAPITTASPAGGTYSSAQTVTLSANEAATIYYTTDGSTPTVASSVYSSAITIANTTTLKFFAKDTAGNSEAVKTETYTINLSQVATPTASPIAGTYSGTQSVTLSSATAGATIRYTTDGSTPDGSSPAYSGAISVSSSQTIKAYATKAGMTDSAVMTAAYTITMADVTAPSVTGFAIPATASTLTVAVTTFTASDNIGVTGYKLTESSSAPLAGDAGWTASSPTDYSFSTDGSHTLYAWAKDAAGNVSTSLNDTVVITLPDPSAAPMMFNQTSWEGGASGLTANDLTDRVNWTQYATSASVNAANTVKLATATTTLVQTNNNATTTSFNLAGYSTSTNTTISGSGDSASLRLAALPNALIAGYHLDSNGNDFAGSNTLNGFGPVTNKVDGGDFGYTCTTKWSVTGSPNCNVSHSAGHTTTLYINAYSSISQSVSLSGAPVTISVDAYKFNTSAGGGTLTINGQQYTLTIQNSTWRTSTFVYTPPGPGTYTLSISADKLNIDTLSIIDAGPFNGWQASGNKYGGAAKVVGVSRLEAGTPIPFSSGSTLAAWVNFSDTGSGTYKVIAQDSSETTSYLAIRNSDKVIGRIQSGTFSPDGTYGLTGWRHFVLINDYNGPYGIGDYVYVDGELYNVWINSVNGTDIKYIGNSSDGINPVAGLDDFLVFNRALSESEIAALYSAPSAYASSVAYPTTGTNTYTSGIIDAGASVANWGNISWTNSGGQTVSMKVRTGASEAATTAAAWGAATTTSGAALASLGATAGHRYIQYQATLSTANAAQTPSVDDVTITYAKYVTAGSLTSSIYDSTSAYTILTGIKWKEDVNLPAGSSVNVYVRTGDSTAAVNNAAWSSAITNATSGCSKDSGTGLVTCAASVLPAPMRSGNGNRYFQYRIELSSTGSNTPTVGEVDVLYFYNIVPQFEAAVTASQIADSGDANFGKVRFDFSLRDTDSTTDQTTATVEYSTDGGTSWAPLASNMVLYNAANGVVSNPLTVATSTYNAYYGIWNVSATLPDTYATTTRVRVIANDGDAYNPAATSTSANFTVDTQAPTIASFAPASAYATSTTVSLNLSASDTNGIADILLSNDGVEYTITSYATTKTWTVTEGDGAKTVYLKVVDNAGNVTTATSTTVTLDTADPTGSISVPTYSTSTAQLTLSATDANNVAQMQFANDGGAYSAFEAYATTKAWPLSAGDGAKTVSVKFKDNAGNISAAYSATTTVDSTAPTGSISINAGATIASSTSVTLDLSASDALSQVNQMHFSTDGSTYSALEPYALSKSYTLPSAQGTTTVYVKFTDNAGNISSVYSDEIILDTQAPTIASFAPASAYATSTTVSLNLSASDTNGIANILLSNDGVEYTTTAYATTKSWDITPGDGTKTIYLKVVDNAGNTTSATSTTVTLDTANPTGSISVPTYSTSTAQLTLSASDANGAAQMQFANDGGAYSAFEAYATTKAWPLSAGDGAKTVSVKFKDNAGNISAAYSATTTVDSTAPTGSISINAGASIATSTSVILDLLATDALSGVNQMQFSANGTDWDSAEAYATTKAYVLAAGDGTKTVYARFIDNAGNVSTSTSDAIFLDTSVPTLAADSLLINGNATTNQSETPNVTLSLQNVAGQPTGETVYVQFSRNGSDWYGANANGTVTANEWGAGFASDTATIASLSWPWTLQSKSETITVRIKDGVVDGVSTDSNQGTYNIAPVVSSVSASQQPDASVRIEYALRDTDNGTVTANLEYSTDGSAWTALDAAITGQYGSLSVTGSDTTFVATWDAATTLAGTYDDSIYVRVTADDGELLNNTGNATSSAFAVDAKAPTFTALLIDGSATPVEAETPNVTLSIAGLQGYPTGEAVSAQFSRDGGTTWYGYASGTSTQDIWGDAFTASPEFAWTLAGRSETISVRLKDSFGNLSTTASNQAAYNIRPEVVIAGAVQATSTGSVGVIFDVRDTDTFTNSVTPTYQYSTNGSTWNAIDPQQLSVTDANGVTVTDLAVSGAYATYTATWDAKTQFPNAVTNVFFKVSVDDAQPIKNIGAATSSAIVVDAKAPTLAADSFLINDSAEIAIASSRDITFKLQNVTGNPTDEIIQARFSRDNGATWSAWSASFATDAATLGATTFPWTMAGRSETLLVSVRDIFGNESETTDENGAGYNLRPQIVSGPSAAQVTDPQNANYGKVAIGYTVKDEDTAEGSTPGQITPTIAYSIDGGVNWNEIASSSASLVLTSGTDGMQPVAASDTILSAAWDAKADLGATYNQNLQIRLTVNDNEGIFNLATATSSIFAIDTTDPVIVSATYNGVTQRLAFHFTDEAAFQYRVSASSFTATTSAATTENANDGAWQDATASVNMTREWIVTATSTAPTVYVQVRDAYGNLSEKTVLAPIAPSRVDFKDNSTGENYIEFVSWPAYTSAVGAQFKQYDLYRSTDGGAFEKIGSSITTRGTNYRTDENLSAGATYTYKVAVTDTDDDVSLFSAPISDIPDGRGSSDALPPIISAVSAPVVQSLWAKIVWTTDEEADSVVEYGTSPTYGFTKTSDAMVKNHEVIVSDLTPNTSYFFKVTSKDGGNNSATDDNGAAGYLFTTPGGPIISGVTASSSDKTATVSWTTDKDSDSHVFYSKNSAFNGYSEAIGSLIGGPTSTTYAHSLTLTDLDPGSMYYFYVQSTTAEGNASLDNNGGSYYTFRTSSDIYPPVISGIATPVRTSQSTVIFWKTNEPATSQVQYGNGTSSLNLSSDYDSTLSTYHSVTLDGLTANTTYQFNVISLDLAGNRGVSTTTAFTTTKEGEVKIVTVGGASAQTPAEAKDTTPPVISDVAVATTTAFTATIIFNTSEPAISSLQYGRDTDYGDIAGEKDYATRHTIRLSGLKMGTEYHFQVQTRDKVGNAAASADATFKTKFFSQANAGMKTIENLQQYEDEVEQSIESILPGILPPFVEEARVTDVTENSATVFWRTNVRSYGVVSYGTDEDFAKTASTSAAYTSEVSDTNTKTLEHSLQLIGLKPNTKYHFKVKSFSLPQVVGEGNDLTFVTKAPKVSASIIDIKNTSFRVIWSTDTPASTIVEYKNTRTGITERIIDEKPVAYHDILVERVAPGASYEVRVFGYAASGALIESGTALSVLTSRDVAAPKISNFKVDGALVPGRTDRVQTVVTWTTDEPSNSTVYYQEGAGQVTKDFANKAEQLDAYTTNHAIILSNLKPGTIYQMKIESVDTAGNKASFGPRTIITPQKGESIFDVIFKNFEDTFKFLRAAGQ